uniref:Uncharacterized protein n=1 Tax=Denticeps clupeoides TaxID=299321 RepID=A0AAY4E3L2_9TELE
MAATPLYCVCRQPYDVSRFMIECDICKDWFHGSCVQVEEHHAVDIDVYHCPNCDVLHGPSLMKKRKNWHRHDYTEADDGTKPVQAGTSVFVQQLQDRTFPSADEILVHMQGIHVTQRYLERRGFRYPIAVPKLDGLGLKLPPSDFTVQDVERYVGGDKIIDVIDVARQADSKIKLKDFVKYYYSPQRPKVLNVISLEFSDTKMSELVVVPEIAQKMSWVENYWPDDSFFPKPFVQKYCLMGVKDSYTDFHIDFGGTSVWYHVLWGEKIFYLIKPTQENLALYEEWSSSPNQSEVFFGDKVERCYKCVVRQGTTLLIPTGWIHAVLTSQDCMAFGGNFLHNLNISMQLRCYEMERRLKTPDLFKFPYFEAICWYVAKNLQENLKELREDRFQPPEYLIKGVTALIGALKSWLKREVTEPASEVPDHIKPKHLIKELRSVSGSKPMKSEGSGICLGTRSMLEKGGQSRKMARRLRDHPHSQKTPSNLDILELHTREVLKRLEVRPVKEVSTTQHGKFRNNIDSCWSHNRKTGLHRFSHLAQNTLKLLKPTSDSFFSCPVTTFYLYRESPPPPGAEEEAIQGMLSMAGLFCSSQPEDSAHSQESWWSSPSQRSPQYSKNSRNSLSYVVSLKFVLSFCMCLSTFYSLLRGLPNHLSEASELQDHKNFMDSQSSNEAWANRSPLLNNSDQATGYQYCESSLSPPLHPTKRPASNPPPVSNQATKGKRPKKGMATAKQRLGRILKLKHHSRFFV